VRRSSSFDVKVGGAEEEVGVEDCCRRERASARRDVSCAAVISSSSESESDESESESDSESEDSLDDCDAASIKRERKKDQPRL
jgi:U3 small nucleolar RNA-associated protein 14